MLQVKNVKDHFLATSDFGKVLQDDINVYIAPHRFKNASFKQKLNPVTKNIFRRRNSLVLVFKDIF